MVSIFEFALYRLYLNAWIEAQGARAYGLKGRIAKSIGVSASLVSQILAGEKSLTPDQASDLCDFLGLNEIESDYFHLLVELDRAGNAKYRMKLERKLRAQQEQSRKIGKRVPRSRELTDVERAIYYSSWLYTGARNLSAVPGFDALEDIAERLQIDLSTAKKVVSFLLANGLCKQIDGKLTYGPASVHVDRESPFANKHHQNWRFRALTEMERGRESDVFFTGPMSLSHEAAKQIRKIVPQVVQDVMKISGPSDSETTACLNIDWFEF